MVHKALLQRKQNAVQTIEQAVVDILMLMLLFLHQQ